MNFPEVCAECVLFLGNREKIGRSEKEIFRPRATAFVVAFHDGPFAFTYLVTAEHNIAAFAEKQWDIWVRSNLDGGGVLEEKWVSPKWWFHPDEETINDVAVAPIGFKPTERWKALHINGPSGLAGTSEVLKKLEVGIGDEVVIMGLFRSHYGKKKNVPIARVGNISLMKGEPIYTRYQNGLIDAYLVEARSISGLSGSPVFVNMPMWRVVNDGNIIPHIGTRVYLLGLMHGHFDIPNVKEDVVSENDRSFINTGIGVVIPVEKIIETLSQPELADMRKQVKKEHAEKNGAAPDFADEPLPATDENPNHRADFMRLANAAAQKQKPAE